MAKILVSFWTENGGVLYNAITNAFLECGNDVMMLNMRNYITFTAWGTQYNLLQKEELWDRISDFNPDLVLSYNNIFPDEFVRKLTCPVCVVDADTPDLAFWNKQELLNNKDRYVFLGLQSISKKLYQNTFGEIKHYLYCPPATYVKNETLPCKNNIVFIGSNFLSIRHYVYNYNFKDNEKLFQDILDVYAKLEDRHVTNLKDFRNKYFCTKDENYDKKVFEYFYYNTLSGIDRILHLSVLSDLGLKIYGLNTWRDLLYCDIELAKCFDSRRVISFEQNVEEYNSSKIAVNISHTQAISSFSWRVMDIMASSACLLMEYKPDWMELFEQYLSKETLDTIIYKDRYDMREKVIKLLNDESLRKRCVLDLNNAIEMNGRWKHRFAILSEYFGISLLNDGYKGNRIYLGDEVHEQQSRPKQNQKHKKFKKLKTRFKLFSYSFLLFLSCVPLISSLFTKNRKTKILGKFHKYWYK